MSLPVVQLAPAIYSKSRNVDDLCRNIKLAPRQVPNSADAWEGHVVDFQLVNRSTTTSYGTLQEWLEAFQPTLFVIHCINGKVFIQVLEDDNGVFFKVRGYTLKY